MAHVPIRIGSILFLSPMDDTRAFFLEVNTGSRCTSPFRASRTCSTFNTILRRIALNACDDAQLTLLTWLVTWTKGKCKVVSIQFLFVQIKFNVAFKVYRLFSTSFHQTTGLWQAFPGNEGIVDLLFYVYNNVITILSRFFRPWIIISEFFSSRHPLRVRPFRQLRHSLVTRSPCVLPLNLPYISFKLLTTSFAFNSTHLEEYISWLRL